MPTEINRKKLGSLFGGEIMSLNYNFQSGSESSTCTLTLINENNEFLVPEMNETVVVPPFGLAMTVLETSLRQDPNYTVLQVELIDSLSDILDKELVLIYGEHTDLNYNLEKKGYYTLNAFAIDEASYFNTTRIIQGSNLDWPEMSRNRIKNYGDGINVIGFSRLTMKKRNPVSVAFEIDDDIERDLDIDTFEGHEWVVYDAGKLNVELSQDPLIIKSDAGTEDYITDYGRNLGLTKENFFLERKKVYSPEDGELQFGYTLKILKDLLLSKGILFEEKSLKLLDDDKILFSDSGTLRSVLTSTLAKVGKTFYIDPLSQKINIVTNADVASINNNLNRQYLNFENTETAQQLDLVKSIKSVSSTHTVAKGELTRFPSEPRDFEMKPKRPSVHRLSKLDGSKLVSSLLNAQDLFLMSRVAPFYFQTGDTETTNNYVYALATLSNGTERWGELYSTEEYTYSEQNLLDKDDGSWYDDLNSDDRYNFFEFDPESSLNAIRLLSSGGSNAISASQSGYLNIIENIITLWGGVYFGSPITESRAERRNYLDTFTGGGQYSFALVKGDEFIANVSELSFLHELVRSWSVKNKQKTRDYRVRDIAKRAGVKASNDLYPVAVRNMEFFSDGTPNDLDFADEMRKQFYAFSSPSGKFLAMKNESESLRLIKNLARVCDSAFNSKKGQTKSSIGVRFQRLKNDKSVNNESDDSEIPKLRSIELIKSRNKAFSKRQLNEFSSGFSETQLFLDNLEELSPEFEGPFISTNVKYYRPPERDDFDIGNGISSISISNGPDGVSTSIQYSSRKFAQVDSSIVKEFLGATATNFLKEQRIAAWQRNASGN